MASVAPFSGQIVRADAAAGVVSPAYDALTSEQRRRHRADHPLCYLHVTRSAPDEDDADTVDDATLVQRGRTALERILDADVFDKLATPTWLIYELAVDGHTQRGLVCETSASLFHASARPHEATNPDRARLLAKHFQTVKAASSPVACTVEYGTSLSETLDAACGTSAPDLEFDSGDGLVQRIWRCPEAPDAPQFAEALSSTDLFIVDGHHRAAATKALLADGIDMPMLIAIFPPDALQLVGFHRFVELPADVTESVLAQRIAGRFKVDTLDQPEAPSRGTVVTRLAGTWKRVTFDERPVSGSPLVRLGSLDPCTLEREIIRPLIAGDIAASSSVSYMPDEASLDAVIAEADAQRRVPFLVPPLMVDDMIEVASGGLTMPAKSTYFTPKVRSGLFLRLL